jgi:hypothetical protein
MHHYDFEFGFYLQIVEKLIKNQIFTGRSQEWIIVNDAGINWIKEHLTLAIEVWTCYSIDTAVIKCWKERLKLVDMTSAHYGCGFAFSYTLTTAKVV